MQRQRQLLPVILALPMLLTTATLLHAQCDVRWQQGAAVPGPSRLGGIAATVWWDPDGPGPRGTVLVLGGQFALPSVGAQNLATWDPATGRFGAFGEQPDGLVQAVAALPNGDLAIGGQFTNIGGTPATNVAIWNRTRWTAPGGGVTPVAGGVRALLALPIGDLVVGGAFPTAGNVTASGLARWDGVRWHACGAFAGTVRSLARLPNGDLLVGGQFVVPGRPGSRNIAVWDGSNWQPLSSGIGGPHDYVRTLGVLTNGDVVATGFFNIAGGVPVDHLARWNGSAWSAMGTGVESAPHTLLPLANGELLAATVTLFRGQAVNAVLRWDGANWHVFARGIGGIGGMTLLSNGELLVAGQLHTAANPLLRGLARWDGSRWQPIGLGFDDSVRGVAPLPNGQLVAFGDFALAEGAETGPVARFDGQNWHSMGSTVTPVQWTRATCSAIDSVGDLWLAGSIPGTPAPGNVGRWTGHGWQWLGAGIPYIEALTFDANRTPIAGCVVYPGYGQSVASWNGSQWVRVGAGLDGPVRALLSRRNGELVAGGEFLYSGSTPVSRIARFDGTAWQPFATGVDGPVRALAELPNGDLVIGGDFQADGDGLRTLPLVARWDGANWQPFGTGLQGNPGASVRTLLVLPDGDLLAGGDFLQAGGTPARGVARWNHAAWEPVDGGVDGTVLSLCLMPDGDVVAAGNFAVAGGGDSAHLARLRPGCPASAISYGQGCNGNSGLLTLTATGRPWIGGAWQSRCNRVSPTGIGIELLGAQPTHAPLASLHPAGGAGCLLLANPDVLQLRLPQNGVIDTRIQLANEPALVGMRLHQQFVVGEVTTGLLITSLASSNALALVVGVL